MFLENTVNHKEQFGWIEVIAGSMFSGKTEELIRRLKRAQFAKLKVEIFKPEIDRRYSKIIKKAFEYRSMGDYNDYSEFTEEEVKEMFDDMVDFITTVERFIASG